jgi:hypothetical protein
MIRRLRLTLLVLTLLLTGLALGPGARAGECVDGTYSWEYFGSCCWQFSPPTAQLLRAHCVDGYWEIVPNYSGYKCPPEPCT